MKEFSVAIDRANGTVAYVAITARGHVSAWTAAQAVLGNGDVLRGVVEVGA